MTMNKRISFLAYTDIHYHHYTNGVTLADVEAVEDEMLQKAIEMKVDFILFGGDRYMSRNPMYEAAFASDRMLKKISDSGIPWFGLIGNHDRTTKNDFKLYTLKHVGMYGKDLGGLTIMDERKEYSFTTKSGCSVTLHAVPAGHAPDNFHVNKDIDFNICVFHAIILGSSYHNGTISGDGLSVSLFDKNGFDLVLAGDNHKKQEIVGLTDCRGYYIGAPMQHNWGDEGDIRGFQEFSLERHGYGEPDNRPDLKTWPFRCVGNRTWIPSHTPRFMKVSWVTDSLEKLSFAAANGTTDWKGNIIKLSVTGPSDVLNDLDINLWKTKLKDMSKARAVDIKLKYNVSASVVSTETTISDADEWHAFLATKQGGLEQIDTAYLEKIGMDYINNV